MVGKAKSSSTIENEYRLSPHKKSSLIIENKSRLSPHESFKLLTPVDGIIPDAAFQQLGYGCKDSANNVRKSLSSLTSSTHKRIKKTRTSSSSFMPICGEKINGSEKRSRLAAFPCTHLSLHFMGSTDPSHQHQIERNLNLEYLFTRDDDGSEEFFLSLPTKPRKHYLNEPSLEGLKAHEENSSVNRIEKNFRLAPKPFSHRERLTPFLDPRNSETFIKERERRIEY